MEIWIPVLVGIITGPVVVILQKLRKQNTEQHSESRGILTHILNKVEKIDDKLDTHIKEGH